jgi:hypothetical protein
MLSIFLNYELEQQKSAYIEKCKERNEFDGVEVLRVYMTMFKNKKEYFKTDIDSNTFLTSSVKIYIHKIFLTAFYKYTVFKTKLIQYIHKKKKSYNTLDLCMNPFINKRQIVYVIDNERKYTFHLHDISNIVVNSLIHSDEYLFSTPTEVKNPYTNIPFKNEQLYIFYLAMQLRGFFIDPLFTFFMQENFNLTTFQIKYEPTVKEYIINNKIKNFPPKTIQEELIGMFDSITVYNTTTTRNNHIFKPSFINGLPANILIHFKPLLYHYFRFVYSNNSLYRKLEYNKLIKKILAFKKSNPEFVYDLKIKIPITNVNYKEINIPCPPSIGFVEAIMYMDQN